MSLRKQKAGGLGLRVTRRTLLLAGPVLLAACSTDDGAPTSPRGPEVNARLLQGRRTLRVTVTGLRPGERVTEVTLAGPDAEDLVAAPATLRQRAAGDPGPGRGVSVTGNSDKGLGVSFGFDFIGRLFGSGRRPPPRLGLTGEAEANIPISDPLPLVAAPEAYRVEIDYLDTEGQSRRLSVIPRI